MSRVRTTTVLLLLAVLVVGCGDAGSSDRVLGRVEPLPGRHDAAEAPSVYVFGDSLTPINDYREQAVASGYDLVADTKGGSWMCGGHEIPQSDGTRWWPRILDAITEERPDFVILEYQAWANYELRCGGLPEQHPYSAEDPGRGWRDYLQMFVEASFDAGGRTRLVVVESPSAPPSLPSWVEPQRIMDEAARTMAARYPGWITFVPIRHETTIDGAWTAFVPCKPYDEGYRTSPTTSCWDDRRADDWPDGQVRLRSGDDIHYWCPTGGGVCAGSSPAGRRIRRAVFLALNELATTPAPAIPSH